jgi:hypothetical protein
MRAPLMHISLEELVPQDHLYRHLERTLPRDAQRMNPIHCTEESVLLVRALPSPLQEKHGSSLPSKKRPLEMEKLDMSLSLVYYRVNESIIERKAV